MRDGHLGALDDAAGCGASHARLALAVRCPLDDGFVRCLDGGAKQCVISVFRGMAGDGANRDGTRDFACGVPAHAIAYAKERIPYEIGVFVVAAYEAHVRASRPGKARIGAHFETRTGTGVEVECRRVWVMGIVTAKRTKMGAAMADVANEGQGARRAQGIIVSESGAHRRLTLITTSPTCTSSPSRRVTGSRMRRPFTSVPFVE